MKEQYFVKQSSKGYQTLNTSDMQFTDQRVIFFTGEVTEESTGDLISKLMFLDSLSDDPITLILSSPGGSCYHGFAVIDLIGAMSSPVNTVCLGMCASMASLLFTVGEKRYIFPNSRVMVHDAALSGIGGRLTAATLKEEIGQLQMMHDDIKELLKKRTQVNEEEAEKLLEGDSWLSADEALKKGFATHIINNIGDLGLKTAFN
ncbi:MAG: ATP-dependent Clp protease proteolytic subunit [Ruminococcus sp.]|nr:ATP-dependent Clp protease proteolytic subunit [Ruminococcus sp.]